MQISVPAESSNPAPTHMWFSNKPEGLDELYEVCLIRVEAKLCRVHSNKSCPGVQIPHISKQLSNAGSTSSIHGSSTLQPTGLEGSLLTY